MRVTVETTDPKRRLLAAVVQETLPVGGNGVDLTLAFRDDAVELRRESDAPGRGFRVDASDLDVRKGSKNLSLRQPLPRALGREVATVVDATAGFGHDGFLLAAMGYDVTLVERSPVVAALLEDGVRRALADARLGEALEGRLRVVRADAREWLFAAAPRPDAVYLDPMFPPKKKMSALPPLAAQLLRAVVGTTDDAADLLLVARRTARLRVVVKRPLRADPLGPGRSHFVAGKLVRYDVHPASP